MVLLALAFIRRNVSIGNAKVKILAYKCYARPVLEYSSTVWDPVLVPPGSWSRYKEERHVILWISIGARLV